MSFNPSFALLAITLAAVVSIISATAPTSAYAEEPTGQGLPDACVGCNTDDSIAAAEKNLIRSIPISVWTDKEEYTHDEEIMVTGYVANPSMGTTSASQVTVVVKNAVGNIVTVDQIDVNDDNTFETALNTGGKLWAYDGTYTIQVQYGHTSNKVKVGLVEGIGNMMIGGAQDTDNESCDMASEFEVMGMCVPYTIEGGMLKSASANTADRSLVIMIESGSDSGVLTLMPSSDVIDGVFMVLVDNEESDDVMIGDDGTITVWFGSDAEMIEVIGEYIIPEFGTIAAMILAVAIVAIIVVSARTSKLNIAVPRV